MREWRPWPGEAVTLDVVRPEGVPGQTLTIDEDGKKTVQKKADEKEIMAVIKKGDWNEYVITCRGNHCVQKINGVTTAEFTDNQPGKAAARGILALQIHQGPPMKVLFKDIQLKKLDGEK